MSASGTQSLRTDGKLNLKEAVEVGLVSTH